MNRNEINKEIGRFCFYFRKEVFGLTLEELSKITNINIKTLSAFENGNSSNYQILLQYYSQGSKSDRILFINGINSIIDKEMCKDGVI